MHRAVQQIVQHSFLTIHSSRGAGSSLLASRLENGRIRVRLNLRLRLKTSEEHKQDSMTIKTIGRMIRLRRKLQRALEHAAMRATVRATYSVDVARNIQRYRDLLYELGEKEIHHAIDASANGKIRLHSLTSATWGAGSWNGSQLLGSHLRVVLEQTVTEAQWAGIRGLINQPIQRTVGQALRPNIQIRDETQAA